MLAEEEVQTSRVLTCSDTGEATLRIIGVASEDDGVYTCVATNELGSVTSSASLRVLGERAAAAGHVMRSNTVWEHRDVKLKTRSGDKSFNLVKVSVQR